MLQIFDKVVQMSRHLVDCPNAGSSCPFSEFGCQYKGDRETLQAHIREEPIRHLALLCDGVLDLKVRFLVITRSIYILVLASAFGINLVCYVTRFLQGPGFSNGDLLRLLRRVCPPPTHCPPH